MIFQSCSYETADIEFAFTLSQALDKGNNLAHHLIQAFEPGEVDYREAHEIGRQLAALQAEYAALQEQKEALYADYGKLKKQVKEYDVIKKNIDSILKVERQPEREKEAERG